MIIKIRKTIQNFEQWQLMIIVILLNFLSSFIFSFLADFFSTSLGKGFNHNYSTTEKLVLFVIIAPILETLIFQYAVIEICKRVKIALKYCCFISALAFAFCHLYNIFYFIYTFVAGLMFAYLYTRGANQKQAILYPFIVHIIYNGAVFIDKVYFS